MLYVFPTSTMRANDPPTSLSLSEIPPLPREEWPRNYEAPNYNIFPTLLYLSHSLLQIFLSTLCFQKTSIYILQLGWVVELYKHTKQKLNSTDKSNVYDDPQFKRHLQGALVSPFKLLSGNFFLYEAERQNPVGLLIDWSPGSLLLVAYTSAHYTTPVLD